MRTELIRIETPTHPLDGAYYTPDGPSKGESMENYPAERFKENCVGPCEVVIVPNCDHFYVGAEYVVSNVVTDWLETTV